MNLQRLVCTLFMITTMALAGCGGGGGGGRGMAGMMDPPAQRPPAQQPGNGGGPTTTSGSPFDEDGYLTPVAEANLVTAFEKAARAIPRAGSVTQSSNVDSRGITTDQVEVTAEYGAGEPRFSVSNGTTWSIGTDEGDYEETIDVSPPWKGSVLSKSVNGGTLVVNAYSDIDAPEPGQIDSGDDGIRDVPIGTMILSAGFTISAGGGITGQRGMLDGESGTFNCSGGCAVASGTITRGMWTFTPDRPPGAVGVSSSDTVTFSTENFDRLNPLPGTRNGQQGVFRCLSAGSGCGYESSTFNGRTRTMLTGDWIFIPASGTTTTGDPDTDYLAGGIWLFIPDDAESADDYVFGAFADGSDPFRQENLMVLQGTATYRGDAIGGYSERSAESTTTGEFSGDVELTANFGGTGNLGTISGSVTNFEVDGEPDDGALNLGTASIGSQNSGFFRGTMTGSDDERSYVGNWGGQFFGNGESDGKPGSVAGTFGGSSTDDVISFVGAFGAYKE